MRVVKFGVIGLGLMGREFASAAARWCHLAEMEVKPEIIAVCAKPLTQELTQWFTDHLGTLRQVVEDYRDLLANPEVEAVYCAVPHHLHRQIYCDTLKAGKHLMGEKPFGIDRTANDEILACIKDHPQLLARCSSQFPFFPAAQLICAMIEQRRFGALLEVNCGFLHGSDLDPLKPINWKRMVEYNGEYGCMGDLGMHVCHVPFRAGWIPHNVRAILSKIVSQRPDGRGGMAPCLTWDNATLLCEAEATHANPRFPLTLKMQRIAPGEKNTWYIEIKGTEACARFSTKNPKRLEVFESGENAQQAWKQIDTGQQTAFPTITGGIFEFGFSDSILQMWAGFLYELASGKPLKKFAGCVTPDETALSHRLFTAALASHGTGTVAKL